MQLPPFQTEEFFGKYEFSKPYLISASDCESINIGELIKLGGGSTEAFLKVKLSYPEMPGSQILREKIASTYSSAQPKDILVLGSPIEGIYLTMHALLQKGDHVIVLSPAYDALYNVAEHVSGNVSRWYLKEEGKSWHLDFEQLEKLLTKPTKLLIINFPHNPTGFLPSKNEWEKIATIAQRHNVRIFSDEIYRGLEYSSQEQLPCMADYIPNSISLGGASKTLGLPGLRFGWLATKDTDLYQELLHLKTYTSMCSTQAGEYLGQMALAAAPQLVEKNLQIIRQNLLASDKFFQKWQKHLTWLKPRAGSVSMVKVKAGAAEKFSQELADRFGVVVLPTKFMGSEDTYVRIGLGRENFAACMEIFDKALQEIYE